MSITTVFEHLGTTAVADVDLVGLDMADIRKQAATISQDGRRLEVIYRYATGDAVLPVTVYVTQRFDPTTDGGKGNTTTTWRLVGVETNTDSVTGEVEKTSYEGGMWFRVAGKYIRSVAEVRQLLNNVFCLTFGNDVTAGVIGSPVLDALASNIIECY